MRYEGYSEDSEEEQCRIKRTRRRISIDETKMEY